MCPFRALRRGLLLVVLTALPLAAAPPRSPSPDSVEHKVLRGETLWSISQKHRTSVGAIMDFNHLPNHNVREGMTLRIPRYVQEDPRQARQHIHIVKRGETFWKIAERYEVSPEMLAKANPNINPNRVHEDMELVIPALEEGDLESIPVEKMGARPSVAVPSSTMVPYTVGENETFYSIAKRYRVPMDAIVAANPTIKPERLRPGMKVWVPSRGAAPPNAGPKTVPAASGKAGTVSKARTHKVVEGESLTSIAKKHGVSEEALMRENGLDDDDVLYVDDVLKIPGSSSALPAQQANAKAKTAPSAPSTATPSPPKPPANAVPSSAGDDGVIRSYIVSAGEDVNSICEAFGISKQQLYEYNRLAPGTRLTPGDEIAIPRAARGRKR